MPQKIARFLAVENCLDSCSDSGDVVILDPNQTWRTNICVLTTLWSAGTCLVRVSLHPVLLWVSWICRYHKSGSSTVQ
jgi:hypothetical protein